MKQNNSKQLFNIDEIDRSIIQIIQEEPNLTHTEIAKKVNRSQPAVGMRIRKLEEAGVLKFQAGISLKTADLILARAEIETSDPAAIEDMVKKCPFMVNGFRLSGSSNISIMLVGFVLKDLDNIVNCHFRTNPIVKNVVLEIISDVVMDLVLPFNLNSEKCKAYSNGVCCCIHLVKANES